MTHLERVKALVSRLQYRKNGHNGFRVLEKGALVFLQHWQAIDRKLEMGRKWYISEHMVDSEIIQTALLAVLTFEEHEAREALVFDGRRVHGPHRSLVDLDKEIECRVEEQEGSKPVEEGKPSVHRGAGTRVCPSAADYVDRGMEQGSQSEAPPTEYWNPKGFFYAQKGDDPYGADDPLKF